MKGGAIAAVVIAPIAAGVLVVVLLLTLITGSSTASASGCTVSGAAVSVQSGALPSSVGVYSGDQVQNAAAILTLGKQLGVSQQAQQVALMAAMTESSLHNDSGGDRDSAGLFQMRPSQGWGSYSQVTDPTYAITLFYKRLAAVSGWQAMAPGDAAQAVEGSAYPDAYAGHAADAVQMMNALSGVTVAVVSTTNTGPTCSTGTGGGTALTVGQAPTGPHAAVIAKVLAFAEAQLGKPYVLGGAGPNVWDCSGLTKEAYAAAGITIDDGHSATTQWLNGVASGHMHPLSQEQPGDLIFWGGDDAWHVGISLGGNMMIAAPKPGDVVKIQAVWGTPNPEVWRPVDALPAS